MVCGAMRKRLRLYLRQEGDTGKDIRNKEVTALLTGFGSLLCSALGVRWLEQGVVGYIVMAGGFFIFLLWLLLRKQLTEIYLTLFVLFGTAAIAYADAAAASTPVTHARAWPLYVIFVDFLLLIEAPRRFAKCVVAGAIVWLTIVEMEYTTRAVGIFDLGETLAVASYDKRRDSCDCERPPCATNDFPVGPLLTLASLFATFILDFLLTRAFADRVLKEKNKMAAAVDAAEHVAGRLADFDLEAATLYLSKHALEMPAELTDSLETLLENLESYRPYLPDELFANRTAATLPPGSPQIGRAPIPGLVYPEVALAFTDIRSSTALWEAAPAAMELALGLHANAIREALAAHDGYEVKTIGDAFMVSFHTSLQAVSFGLAAQTSLGAEVQWPSGLTRPDLNDGFGVLTVRMGVHCGEAVVQRSTLTGRYDYFGPMVNRAARVEPFGAPGAVTVTAEVMADVGGVAVLDGVFVVPYAEAKRGKGLKDPLQLTALIPERMSHIQGSVQEVTSARLETAWIQPPRTTPPAAAARSPRPRSSSRRESTSSDVLQQYSDVEVLSTLSGSWTSASVSPAGSVSVSHRFRPAVFCATAVEGACVGVVRFTTFFDDADIGKLDAYTSEAAGTEQRLQVVHNAVQATRGIITSVVNDTAWVSWGLQTRCAQYVNESARCMILLRERLASEHSETAPPAFYAGLVTGSVATVELAASLRGRRFVTLLGPCVALASALCSSAPRLGMWVLTASIEGSEADRHAEVVIAHPVDKGALPHVEVQVYTLDVPALASASCGDIDAEPKGLGLIADRSEFGTSSSFGPKSSFNHRTSGRPARPPSNPPDPDLMPPAFIAAQQQHA